MGDEVVTRKPFGNVGMDQFSLNRYLYYKPGVLGLGVAFILACGN
jgi:hypothetical protein